MSHEAGRARGLQATTGSTGRAAGSRNTNKAIVNRAITRMRPSYDRDRDLPRLIAVWPHELGPDQSIDGPAILRKLQAALRAERQRGLAGHWTYDLARHSQLVAAYRAERQRHKSCNIVKRAPAPDGTGGDRQRLQPKAPGTA